MENESIIPFYSFSHQHKEVKNVVTKAFNHVYEGGQFIGGSAVAQFEKEYAQFSQSHECVTVANGTDAIFIALKALGIGRGDEVIVPAHGYVATWLAVNRTGAVPVPVECDPAFFTIDNTRLEEVRTSKTKAIVPIHLYGQPCAMDDLLTFAQRHGLWVVEDNAQAHGATWKGRRTGSFGIANATSFYPTKNLGALGDGGAITTSDSELAAFMRRYRNYGFQTAYVSEHEGVNARLDELQAAILREKLLYLEKWNAQRQQLAAVYSQALQDVGDIILPAIAADAEHVFHLYVIQTTQRDALQQHLKENGIESKIHYPVPVHLQPAFQHLGYQKGSLPIAERLAQTILSLPLWPGLSSDQQERIIFTIRAFFKK